MVDTTPSSDVPTAWLMGVSWGWLTPGRIKDQPCKYGTIMTMRRDIDAQQLLIAPSGETWSRGSSSATQTWGAFIKLG